MDLEAFLQTLAQYYAQYFTPYVTADYEGDAFQHFGLPHLTAIGITALILLFIVFTRNKLEDEDRAGIREVMGQILLINQIGYYIWLYTNQNLPPLNLIPRIPLKIIPITLIGILVWLSIFMLFKKRQTLYETVYLIGTIPALYALIIPAESPYGFPHFLFFFTLIPPAIIFLASIYMSVAETEMEIRLISILRALVVANLIAAIVYGINLYLGTNFLNLLNKPKTSPFPLPDAPLHLLYYEGIAIVSSLILYLPFLIKDMIRRRNLNADTERIKDFI
ncbi:MAG TPA: TIGR02206 family membrane protein [Anaerolineales bacterium]|nr:TIGR02206 family membrane protein [Anaerolineales bacterium]